LIYWSYAPAISHSKSQKRSQQKEGVLSLFFQVQTAQIGNYTNLHHLDGDFFVVFR